jgi:PAS domain S-box-containing protein
MKKYYESPSVVAHQLHRAYYEGDEAAQAHRRQAIERMCRFIEGRQCEVVSQWLRQVAELLPQTADTDLLVPGWWRELSHKFLYLLLRHLGDPTDIACHRFVGVATRAGNKAGYTAADLVCTQIALKRTLIANLVAEFGDDRESLEAMCDRVESEIDHVRLHITECYYEYNQRELLRAEQKHWALFNAAGDAVVLVDPTDGVVVDANREAEALFGLEKDDLVGSHYPDLFAESSRQAIVDRLSAAAHEGTSFLDRARLISADGERIQARVRSTAIRYAGARVVQSLIRDETGLWRTDGEGATAADEQRLERIVALRTRELHQSVQKSQRLYREQHRQVERLALLQEIAEAALGTRTVDDLLALVAAAVRRHFRFSDISVFSVEPGGDCVLRSHCGAYEPLLRAKHRQKSTEGLLGEAVRTLRPVLVNEVSKDPRYVLPFPAARRTRAELLVPVISGDRCVALLDIHSQKPNAFSESDQLIIQAVAGQLAVALAKVSLHEQTARAQEFSEQIIQGMPSSLIVVDGADRVKAMNEHFAREADVDSAAALGQPIAQVIEPALLAQASFVDLLATARRTGETVKRQALHHWSPSHPDRFLDIRLRPLGPGEGSDVLIVINNVTDSSRRMYQLELIHRVSRLIQSALDEDYVLHAALTCVTAGPALGFNRAFVFLADEEEQVLRGRVAVGPRDEQEAHQIYSNLAEHSNDLRELVRRYDGPKAPEPGSLHELVQQAVLPLHPDSQCPLVKVFFERKPLRFTRAEHPRGPGCCALAAVIDSEECAVAALEAEDRAIGVVLADNRFTNAPIRDEEVRLLATLARQAGMALANARAHAEVARKADQLASAYKRLKDAHEDLVRQEKLATAGEMSARVSHEIRNPLVTIGGFAHSILEDDQASAVSQRNARIIVDEVAKLEAFLTNWLDLARPADSVRSPEDLNALVEHALLMANVQSLPEGIVLTKQFGADLPPVVLDPRRLQQAIINIALNAVQAMNGGSGTLTVRTRCEGEGVRVEIGDTGVGIPAHVLGEIFTPFFTTKLSGSGLGLAVTQAIVRDHGGRVEVDSAEGEGTTVALWLPVERELREEHRPAEKLLEELNGASLFPET